MTTTALCPPRLLTRKQAAAYLGVTPGTLAVWASTKRQVVPCIRMGKRLVRYRQEDLDAFLRQHLDAGGAEAA